MFFNQLAPILLIFGMANPNIAGWHVDIAVGGGNSLSESILWQCLNSLAAATGVYRGWEVLAVKVTLVIQTYPAAVGGSALWTAVAIH